MVIGGGFYGLKIAIHLSQVLNFKKILILESGPAVMNRSSFNNQARVHNGYHYPRSLLTASRSRINSPLFTREFQDAIDSTFEHYYAIPTRQSKTSPDQFFNFSHRIGAFVEPAEQQISNMFSPAMISKVFLVKEPAFNSRIIRDMLLSTILKLDEVEIKLSSEVTQVSKTNHGTLLVKTKDSEFQSQKVFNATYSEINTINLNSDTETVGLQHELTEMPLISVPPELTSKAITVMDGPFFSIMPFPSSPFSTLSHVRYTPHIRWREPENSRNILSPTKELDMYSKNSNFAAMKSDATRFLPCLSNARYEYSLWESKTVLMSSEASDSRPILYRSSKTLPGFASIMGGKLDNVYDVLDVLSEEFGTLR